MAPWARGASFAEAPAPPSGFAIRIEAKPQAAIAQEWSSAATSAKVSSAAEYQNECSMATPRVNFSFTAGLHEFGNSTLPSCSAPWAKAATATKEATAAARTTGCIM